MTATYPSRHTITGSRQLHIPRPRTRGASGTLVESTNQGYTAGSYSRITHPRTCKRVPGPVWQEDGLQPSTVSILRPQVPQDESHTDHPGTLKLWASRVSASMAQEQLSLPAEASPSSIPTFIVVYTPRIIQHIVGDSNTRTQGEVQVWRASREEYVCRLGAMFIFRIFRAIHRSLLHILNYPPSTDT